MPEQRIRVFHAFSIGIFLVVRLSIPFRPLLLSVAFLFLGTRTDCCYSFFRSPLVAGRPAKNRIVGKHSRGTVLWVFIFLTYIPCATGETRLTPACPIVNGNARDEGTYSAEKSVRAKLRRFLSLVATIAL